jgi:hypothetical protein
MTMPRGDKSSYTDKQKRKAEHIEEGYEKRGVGTAEAERRAWATVNKESGGGNKSGSVALGQEGGGDTQAARRGARETDEENHAKHRAPDRRTQEREPALTDRAVRPPACRRSTAAAARPGRGAAPAAIARSRHSAWRG